MLLQCCRSLLWFYLCLVLLQYYYIAVTGYPTPSLGRTLATFLLSLNLAFGYGLMQNVDFKQAADFHFKGFHLN
jgi:hypothetical protein